MEIILEQHRAPPDRSPDDRDFVERAQAGDTAAFEQLYRMQVGRIYALCVRMVPDPVRAETLTQDAFVRAWQQLRSFRGESAFSTWLYRLAVNVVLTDLRSEKRRKARVESTDNLTLYDVATNQPSCDTDIDLNAGIAALPAKARAVLILHDIEGYRHDEIGKMLDIAPGSSKAHLHRARKLLRKMLASRQ